MHSGERIGYRPDIDGLRAIAVLSVILFHIDAALLPGGFVGVDIFFVISGFLISRTILQDLGAGRFSIGDFYRRRVKRIAPPMLVVVATTLVIAQLVMLPEDAESVAQSVIWSLLSLANVHFWLHMDTGYFAAASSDTPLLHLWSLGVEEQFYLLWPLLLALAFRLRWSKPAMLAVTASLGAVASFALGELIFESSPAFSYYMLPTRAGELLVGALAAIATLHGIEQRISPRLAGPMAVAGLFLLTASLWLISEDQVFPGLLALPPTLGTALVILAGHCGDNRVSRCLSASIMVWIGLLSYSAYLWHWPLLAFLQYGNSQIDPMEGAAVIVATFLLAWLTYRYVEQPARRSNAPALQIFARQYVAPAAVLAVVSLGAMKIDGYGLRWLSDTYKTQLAGMRQATRPSFLYDYVCQHQHLTPADAIDKRCILGDKASATPRAILWGDSTAAQYIGMVGAFAASQHFQFRNLEIGSCPPIYSDPEQFVTAQRLPHCRDGIEIARHALRQYDVVVISAFYVQYLEESEKFLDASFATTHEMASEGQLVIILGSVPIIRGYDRRCREKAIAYPHLECPEWSVPLATDVSSVNARLREFAEGEPRIEYFDVTSYLCPGGTCSAFDRSSGDPLYYDGAHLSMPASWQLGARILRADGVPMPFQMISGWKRPALMAPDRRTSS